MNTLDLRMKYPNQKALVIAMHEDRNSRPLAESVSEKFKVSAVLIRQARHIVDISFKAAVVFEKHAISLARGLELLRMGARVTELANRRTVSDAELSVEELFLQIGLGLSEEA